MIRRISLFLFFMVMVSLASNILAGFMISLKVEMMEKDGKEISHESDFEKDKIFQESPGFMGYICFVIIPKGQNSDKIISPALDTEINPPDSILI